VAAGSAGLGLASARALVAAGVHVAICGRDANRLAEARISLEADAAAAGDGITVVALRADVSTTAGAIDFVKEADERLGGLDILVANAGGPPAGNFASTDLDAYLSALELNLLSTVAMCHASVPAMVERGWGRVVAITSVTVRQPVPGLILSNTARAGATAFLKTLASEVAPHGVTVNSVQPGSHDTDRLRQIHGGDPAAAARSVPTGVLGRPDDFGAVLAFVCSDQARFITGAAIPVDGGAAQGLQ